MDRKTISEEMEMGRPRRWLAEHGKEILCDLLAFAAQVALVILAAYLFSRTSWMAAMEARFEPRWLRTMLSALTALLGFAANRIRSDGGEKPPLAQGLEIAALFPLALAALTL